MGGMSISNNRKCFIKKCHTPFSSPYMTILKRKGYNYHYTCACYFYSKFFFYLGGVRLGLQQRVLNKLIWKHLDCWCSMFNLYLVFFCLFLELLDNSEAKSDELPVLLINKVIMQSCICKYFQMKLNNRKISNEIT